MLARYKPTRGKETETVERRGSHGLAWEDAQSEEESGAYFSGIGKENDQRTWEKLIWPKKGDRLGALDTQAWQETATDATRQREEPSGPAHTSPASFTLTYLCSHWIT